MKDEPITKAQLAKLHIDWGLYATEDCTDQDRFSWASRNVGRKITSFKELTRREAHSLIDILQRGLELVS